jgi:IS30 family transposase
MYKHLTQNEYYYIWQSLVNKSLYSIYGCPIVMSVVMVAEKLSCHRSTVYRALNYIKANGWSPNRTSTVTLYKRKRKRNKLCNDKIRKYIVAHLTLGWSPEVISNMLWRKKRKRISFKSIYRYIWEDKRNGGMLYSLLPHQGKKYKYDGGSKRSSIVNRKDISERPAIVENKSRLGDLEGDTIVGSRAGNGSCLLTLVDRKSKYCQIRKIEDKSALSVEKAMVDCYNDSLLPYLTITYDNGTEFANHQEISQELGCDIYFARPYRSCDRGLNEHTNGLIRRYFPNKTDFGKISEKEIRAVENLLNNRPRKSLNYLTPNEVLNKELTKAYKKCRTLFDNWRCEFRFNYRNKNIYAIILKIVRNNPL